jgi:small subunit ribosomal protein S20
LVVSRQSLVVRIEVIPMARACTGGPRDPMRTPFGLRQPTFSICLTSRELPLYNRCFGPTRISLETHEGNEPDMANHFSALKRARQTERRTTRNRANTSRLRSQLRELRESIAKGDKAAAEQAYRQTVSALDKAIQKGTLHENTASRYKSRLSARLAAIK